MQPARKTVATMLVALMFGTVAPNVSASVADLAAPPPASTIGTPKGPSSAEFATETLTARQILSKRVERHRSESLTLPSRPDTLRDVHACARLIASCRTAETVARATIRGRAPPI